VIPWNRDVILWNRDVILWNHDVIFVFSTFFLIFAGVGRGLFRGGRDFFSWAYLAPPFPRTLEITK
jgi:hypothetical protein